MAQRLERAIRQRRVPPSHLQVHQLRHARQVLGALIRQRLRAADVEVGHALQLRQSLHGIVGNAAGLEVRNPALLHYVENLVPVRA